MIANPAIKRLATSESPMPGLVIVCQKRWNDFAAQRRKRGSKSAAT
jgi:hypothetical protein